MATELAGLVEAALGAGVPIDITTSPALWGGYMRGSGNVISCVSTADYVRAADTKHAGDLIDANLIETLSCIGRDYLDFYFLRVRGVVEEFRIAGALESLEMAREAGHVRYLGVACDGPALSTWGLWRLHDAFDVLLAPGTALFELASVARERRVGTIELRCGPPSGLGDVEMFLVQSAGGVAEAVGAAR